MTWLSEPMQIAATARPDFDTFHNVIRPTGKPMVMRGLVADWPSVTAALAGESAMIAYLNRCGTTRPVTGLAAAPSEQGRFFYNPQLTGLNFIKGQGELSNFLNDLVSENAQEQPHALSVQSEVLRILSPPFAEANRLDLLPDVDARIWLGNRVRTATHYDLSENVACNVAGRRRFTVFPPDQIANLYVGPLELTPAGTPTSLVDPLNPDLDRFPRFAQAWKHAQTVTLEPGDGLYLPYGWWHAVDSLDSFNILVNYWWNNPHEVLASPYDALLHMIAAFRHLPPEQRNVWRTIADYFAFGDIDPGAHLPEQAKGMLAPYAPGLIQKMMRYLKASMQRSS
jgi:hypothetical protein